MLGNIVSWIPISNLFRHFCQNSIFIESKSVNKWSSNVVKSNLKAWIVRFRIQKKRHAHITSSKFLWNMPCHAMLCYFLCRCDIQIKATENNYAQDVSILWSNYVYRYCLFLSSIIQGLNVSKFIYIFQYSLYKECLYVKRHVPLYD